MLAKEQSLSAKEGEEVELGCDIVSAASSPSRFYNVSWLYARDNLSSSYTLVRLDHAGLLSYPENPGLRGLQRRLRLSRPARTSSLLGIQGAEEGDGGTYWCKVELFQLDRHGEWQKKASGTSGPIALTVNAPGMKKGHTETTSGHLPVVQPSHLPQALICHVCAGLIARFHCSILNYELKRVLQTSCCCPVCHGKSSHAQKVSRPHALVPVFNHTRNCLSALEFKANSFKR